MKVLHIITRSDIGGAQTWVSDQVKLMDNYGVESYLITSSKGWLTENVKCKKTLILNNLAKKFSFKCLFDIINFVKDNEIDVIVGSSANGGLYTRLLSLFSHCRIVYVSHGWSCLYNGGKLKKLYCFIEKILSHLTDTVICVSKNDFNDAQKILKINKSRLVYIRNSVFIPSFSKLGRNVDKNFPLKVLSLGRLDKPKRVDLLISSLSSFFVEIHIVGDGPLRSELEKLSLEEGGGNVFFHGSIDSFQDFNSYDVFTLFSDSEGLPMSALEAASAGLPLIVSNVGGCYEIVEGNGLLVDNNIEDIQRKFSMLIDDYPKYKKTAEKIMSDFDIEQSKLLYFHVYFPCVVNDIVEG